MLGIIQGFTKVTDNLRGVCGITVVTIVGPAKKVAENTERSHLKVKFFQVEQDLSIGISAVSASGDASDGPEVPLANGEKSKKEKASKKEEAVTPKKKQADDDKKHGVTRVYSSFDTSGKLYLKSIRTVAEAEAKKQSKIIKYPLVRIRGSRIHIHSFDKIRENAAGQTI